MNKPYRDLWAVASLAAFLAIPATGLAQEQKASGAAGAMLTPAKAIALAEQGRCKEAIGVLRKTVTTSASKDERKRAGVLGIRCAMTADDRLVAGELLGQLGRQFPNDPEV